MDAHRGESFQNSLTLIVLVGKPYNIPSEKILIKQIYVMGSDKKLGLTFTVGEKAFQEIRDKLEMDTVLDFIDFHKSVSGQQSV